MINRNEAWKLLTEHVESESLRRHCLAVEAAMRAYAQKHGQDPDKWGMVGLLHDFDYEKFPQEHPFRGSEILKERGYSDEIVRAILGHASFSGVPRDTQMAKCLFAVDELAGFIVACALVRPEKLAGLESKSVKKKLKRKDFAANVSREEIEQGVAELGIDKDEHIGNVISALRDVSFELGF